MPRAAYLAVLGAAALCYAALGAVLRILPELVDDPATLGLLVGAPALTAVVTRPAGGRVADRVGAAPVMLAGALVMAAGVIPALASDSTTVLLASRLLVGAGEGAMMSACVLWLLRLTGPERRGQALGHIGLANYAGLTAGPLLAEALDLDRSPVLIAAAVLPLAGVALAVRVPRPHIEPAAEGGAVLREVLVPGAGLMLVNLGYVTFLAFGGAQAGTALVVPVFAAGVIAVRTLGASLPDRLGGQRTLTLAAPTAAAGLLVVSLGTGTAAALAGTVVLALGQGLAVPALGLLALARVPARSQGAAAGLFFAFFDAGVGAGGPIAGGVARLSSPATALALAAGAVATSALSGRAADRAHRRAVTCSA
jgi:predicted MFS family arabinose efflux permease